MRLGIIGTGRIAERFVPETLEIEDVILTAVYNPHRESAKRFSARFCIPVETDEMGVLLANTDAVYIASPHETHYGYAKELLRGGKHVLCEKPLCLKNEQAEELFSLAEKKGLILMEAIKTSWCPGFIALLDIVASGRIGVIRDVEACFTRLTPPGTREMTDTDYGGSFTEFGSYVLLPVIRLLGTGYKKLIFQSLKDEKGIDLYTKAVFEYDGAFANVKTGLGVKSEGQLVIAGTKGYILAQSPWWLTRSFEVRYEDAKRREVYSFPYEGQGLRYEIQGFVKAVKGEAGPGGLMPAESVAMAGIMEKRS